MMTTIVFLVVLAVAPQGAAWPTSQPLATLPPAPQFATPVLPASTIQPWPTPALPTPALALSPTPLAGGGVYSTSVDVFTDVISAAHEAMDGLGTGIDDLETAVGLEEGSGDWTPGFITTTTTYEMADTLVGRLALTVAYLKGISTLGLSSGSLLGPTIIFLLVALAWIGLVLVVQMLAKLIFWVIDLVADIVNAIPFA